MISLQIRDGELADTGSWVYVWLRPGWDRPVIYVGGTGLPPVVRTWLHLHDPDPGIGRVAARYGDLSAEPLDVLAFELPPSLPRPTVKAAAIQRLHTENLLAQRYVGDPPAPIDVTDEVTAIVDRVLAAITGRG